MVASKETIMANELDKEVDTYASGSNQSRQRPHLPCIGCYVIQPVTENVTDCDVRKDQSKGYSALSVLLV